MPEFNVDIENENGDVETHTINIEVWCNVCGRGICHLANIDWHSTGQVGVAPPIYIDLCPDCIESIETEAYEDGWYNGYNTAKDDIDS